MVRRFLSVIVVAVLAVAGTEPRGSAQFAPAPANPDQSYSGEPQQPQYPPGQYGSPSYPQSPDQNGPSYAGNGTAADSDSNPAADRQHGVARISIAQGDVNVRRGDTGQLEAAAINAPLMASDHLQTSPGSRAEVELDSGNLIRLGPNTDIGFANLEYHRYQVQLGAGTIIYRVLRDAGSQAEIDTPNIAVRPLGVGEYRISVMEDGTTQITVRSGQAEIDSPEGSQQLAAGQTTLVRGTPNQAEFQTTAEIGRDQLDDWSATRDSELLASQSYRYVSPDIGGADDLDQYGNWVQSQYGQVWQPQGQNPDWSPYSDGQWGFEPYYGWTWVDAAPWGWAPYHYGRWFLNGGFGWCWWPGAVRASYWWNPALVGFFGWGGGLGWVALAPYEIFHPWWGHGFFGAG
ncbi:MAG: FecR domain-containing protein, partial [Acidobacteriaceae bacterium]|nr:FecR domain-containing protein [Acidobacteriaceae bacterium]